MTNKIALTYSALTKFQSCPRSYKYRYIDCLVPKRVSKALQIGSKIHQCLATLYDTGKMGNITENEFSMDETLMMLAMLSGYVSRYTPEQFKMIETEKVFKSPIINPATGHKSLSFDMSGRVDGIAKIGDNFYLVEHKTASIATQSYLERMWSDFQITLYSYHIQKHYKIKGVIYNVLVKARLKRKRNETDHTFYDRLRKKYDDPAMFLREEIYLDRNVFDSMLRDVWDITQAILWAKRNNAFPKNLNHCYRWYRECEYGPLCRSHDSTAVLSDGYEKQIPNIELEENDGNNKSAQKPDTSENQLF